jgi:hypothetical protein
MLNENRMSNSGGPFRQRALLILGILVFIACYQWVYIHWLNPTFDYFGYEYNPPSAGYLLFAWLLSALPSLWMPLSIDRPSKLIYWVLYLTVFIPSMFIPLFAGINKPSEVTRLMIVLFAGFAITGLSYRRPLLKLKPPRLTASRFWFGFTLIAVVCTVWVLIAFRGNFQIASFIDIYDVRNAADDVMAGTLVNYPLMWLYGAISPFLMGWGLFYRRASVFGAGMLGQVLVYSCFGNKASILSIFFILGFYLLFRVRRFPFGLTLTWSLVAIFVSLSVCSIFAENEVGSVLFTGLTLVFMRTFGLAGLLTAQYYYFFQHNPLTFYSHLKLINLLIHYPYHYYLGSEIGYYYYGSLVDTTAHLWAMDGIAALGLVGILFISVVCTLVFWLLDSAAQKHDPLLTALVVSYAAYNLANLPLFTTLLSRGLGLLIVIFYLMPREQSEASSEPMVSGAVAPAS